MPASSDALLATLKALHPRSIDLSLTRIERLLAALGHPERRLPPVVHVAGTNGKGSVTAYLKAMLEAADRRVHVYTSPHLVRFHERIALAGEDGRARPIAEAHLVDVLSRALAANAGAGITQFEIETAAAFLAFAETPADALVLEVGLGGRLDATNVVADPALCVITPVSLDHTERLGPTVDLIAREKAGILKRGVMAVVAPQDGEAIVAIDDVGARVGARLIVGGRDFDAYEQSGRLLVQVLAPFERLLDLPRPALLGRHQIVNAGTAVVAGLMLDRLGIDERAIERGLLEVRWPARMQRLSDGPVLAGLDAPSELWLDGGHNPAAGAMVAQTLADLDERAPKPVHLVVGMLANKDVVGFLAPFRGLVRSVTTVPVRGGIDPGHAPAALAQVARELGLPATTAADVPAALAALTAVAPGAKRVVICGSLYLAGEVLALQETSPR